MATSVQQRLAVISEPSRFRIVELLKEGPQSVGEIVDELALGQPQVSRHLRLLAEAEVVDAAKSAQRRIYRLRPGPMREVSDWVEQFAGLWSDRMERLGSVLEGLDEQGVDDRA